MVTHMSKLFLFMISVVLIANCSKQGKKQKSDFSGRQINAVVTTGMLADAVKNIGGDRVQVTAMMGPGVDPHLYKASEGDVRRMSGADIIFYNGLHLEGKLTEIFERMARRVTTIAAAESIPDSLLQSSPTYTGLHDPHVWFDVSLWRYVVQSIRDALTQLDPPHADTYQQNALQYLEQLTHLQTEIKQQIASLPREKRILITAHDAFHYFGRAYDFKVRGLQGISTSAEAGTADVQALAKYIVDKKVPAVFIETSVPARYIEALQAAVNAKGYTVDIGGHLYSDAMGDVGTPEGEYIGMVRYNVNTIVSALKK